MICVSLLIDKISPSVNKPTFISVDYCKAIMHPTAVGPMDFIIVTFYLKLEQQIPQ